MDEIELAITEAWRWLEFNLFLVPAGGFAGQSGWSALGRRGRAAIKDPKVITACAKAASFPRELLHPRIAESVWAALASGDYADGMFIAFRSVEEAVRAAGDYSTKSTASI